MMPLATREELAEIADLLGEASQQATSAATHAEVAEADLRSGAVGFARERADAAIEWLECALKSARKARARLAGDGE